MDPIMLATRAALNTALMPKCTVEKVGNKFEFDVSEEETETIPGCENVPLVVTLNKVGSLLLYI